MSKNGFRSTVVSCSVLKSHGTSSGLLVGLRFWTLHTDEFWSDLCVLPSGGQDLEGNGCTGLSHSKNKDRVGMSSLLIFRLRTDDERFQLA